MIVTADDLRALLSSNAPGATLVLEEGKARVYTAAEAAERSSWVLTTQDDLRRELPDAANPTPHDLEEKAALLDDTVAGQGG